MSERYTNNARQAVVLAQEEARALGHGSVGPEHLLLGLLGPEHATAARALSGLGLTHDRARAEVERIAGRGRQALHGQIGTTPRARHVLEQAFREAMSLGADEVGTEHVLLALLGERDGVAGEVLGAIADAGVVRDEVLRTMSEPPPDQGPSAAGGPALDVPVAVSVRLSEDVRRLLRRAAGRAIADDESEVGLEHIRRALDG